jgi:hypothetical protein
VYPSALHAYSISRVAFPWGMPGLSQSLTGVLLLYPSAQMQWPLCQSAGPHCPKGLNAVAGLDVSYVYSRSWPSHGEVGARSGARSLRGAATCGGGDWSTT